MDGSRSRDIFATAQILVRGSRGTTVGRICPTACQLSWLKMDAQKFATHCFVFLRSGPLVICRRYFQRSHELARLDRLRDLQRLVEGKRGALCGQLLVVLVAEL